MKYFFLILVFSIAIVLSVAGFRGHRFAEPPLEVFPDMDRQGRVNEQSLSDFFADGLGSRRPVAGTIPMGFRVPGAPSSSPDFVPAADAFTHARDYYNTGRFGDYWGDGFPEEIEVTPELLARGRDRFDIHCAVCHGTTGDGQGITAKYGVPNIANFHLPQFADPAHPDYRTDGSVFDTISNGKGLMGSYGANLTVRDRWAVVAWVRALQKSRVVPQAEVADEFSAAAAPAN